MRADQDVPGSNPGYDRIILVLSVYSSELKSVQVSAGLLNVLLGSKTRAGVLHTDWPWSAIAQVLGLKTRLGCFAHTIFTNGHSILEG